METWNTYKMRHQPFLIVLAAGLLLACLIRPSPAADQPGTAKAKLKPSPLDKLDPAAIPAQDRFSWQPKELVAVLGEHRGRHWAGVNAVAYSPDGKTLASCSGDRTIRLWDSATLQEKAVLAGHTRDVNRVAFAKDGKLLVSGSTDETVRLWDLTGPQPREKAVLPINMQVYHLVLSPDGRTLVWGYSAVLPIWDISGEQPKERAVIKHGNNLLYPKAISPDGKILAATCKDKNVTLWDISEAEPKKKADWEAHPGTIRNLAFAPNRNVLVTGGDEGYYRFWDLTGPEPKLQAELKKNEESSTAMAFSPKGDLLVTGWRNETVALWDITGLQPKEKAILQVRPGPSLAFSPDGRCLATGTWNGAIDVWDMTAVPPQRKDFHRGHGYGVVSLALSPNGLLASSSGGEPAHLWDLSGDRPRERGRLPDRPSQRPERQRKAWVFQSKDVAFAPNGKTLFGGGSDGDVRKWDLSGPAPREGHVWACPVEKGVSGFVAHALSADGRLLAIGRFGKVEVWEPTQPREVATIQVPGLIRSLDFSPGGRWLAISGHQSPRTLVWDGRHPESPPITAAFSAEEMMLGAAFSGDEHLLAIVAGIARPVGKIYICDLPIAQPLRPLVLAVDWRTPTSVAMTDNGRTVAASDSLGNVVLWDIAAGKRMHEWKLPGAVTSLLFSKDGRHLLTGNANGTIYVLRIQIRHEPLPKRELAALWSDLASDEVAKVYPAIWGMAEQGEDAIRFIRPRVKATAAIDPTQVPRLIAELDADRFAVREAAMKALAVSPEQVESQLRQALKKDPSPEARRRLESLLADILVVKAPDRVHCLRAIQVLERIGSAEAILVLRELSRGAPAARETQDALAAIARMGE